MVVVIFVAEKEDVPPWLLWGGGVIIAGLAGGFIGRKINVKKKKPLAKDKDLIELKPVLDGGKQTLESDSKSLIQNKLHFKYISDTGTQTIKTE
jgi:hypothetical protein